MDNCGRATAIQENALDVNASLAGGLVITERSVKLESAVHVDHLARDVARQRWRKKNDGLRYSVGSQIRPRSVIN